MRDPLTVFVVGAGASEEAGLPIGKELVDDIVNRLGYAVIHGSVSESGDRDILDVLQQYAQDRAGINSFLEAARRVCDGAVYSNSIDSFIDVHRDDANIQVCGKLAIAKSILEAESKSKLYIDRRGVNFAD